MIIDKEVPQGGAQSMECESLTVEMSGLLFGLEEEDLPLDEILAIIAESDDEEDVPIFWDDSDWLATASDETPEKMADSGAEDILNGGARFKNWSLGYQDAVTEIEPEYGTDTELEGLKALASMMFFGLIRRWLAIVSGKTLLAEMILTGFEADHDYDDWFVPPKINESRYDPETELSAKELALSNEKLGLLTQLHLIDVFGDPWEEPQLRNIRSLPPEIEDLTEFLVEYADPSWEKVFNSEHSDNYSIEDVLSNYLEA